MMLYAAFQGEHPLALRVAIADTFFTRFRGLMLRKELAAGEGLLLKNCTAIHCCFMRFSIDAVYLDGNMQVVAAETVKPWCLGRVFPGVRHVLELEAGRARDLKPGLPIEWKECAAS